MSEIERTPGGARGRCRSVTYGDFVWTVGTGTGASVAEQTRSTLAQIENNLKEAGTDKHRILEATVYLTDMATKAEMDEVWCDWIPDDGWPCRACVGTDLAPGDLVEVKLIAAK
ncbi:RidA family protein [Pelagibius sp. Alg239-R121]|uniref:RidA family protein n=1 Tax=Pelagibius sp. Alg239-R121 TaxID=2993448 RepID=UPI0024A67DED|nr:RidA family protein [Pelagibius sp. Alg239-R121]